MKKKQNLSPEARGRVNLGSEMMAKVLQSGGIPEIVIGAKPGSMPNQVDYFIVSPLEEPQIRYVLARVLGLLDGSILQNN